MLGLVSLSTNDRAVNSKWVTSVRLIDMSRDPYLALLSQEVNLASHGRPHKVVSEGYPINLRTWAVIVIVARGEDKEDLMGIKVNSIHLYLDILNYPLGWNLSLLSNNLRIDGCRIASKPLDSDDVVFKRMSVKRIRLRM